MKDFPWRRKVVEPLSENNCLTMYEDAALVYFTGSHVTVVIGVVVSVLHTTKGYDRYVL